jgi:hypothetical protein
MELKLSGTTMIREVKKASIWSFFFPAFEAETFFANAGDAVGLPVLQFQCRTSVLPANAFL